MIEVVVLTIIQIMIMIITLAIGFRSYQVASLHPDSKMTYVLLASGFIIVGFGVVIEGILYQFFHLELIVAHSLEALSTALGLLLILLAIYHNRS